MPTQNGNSAAKTTADAKRMEKAAARKKKAAEDLAEANAILGIDEAPELAPEDDIPEPTKLERILDDLNLDGSFEVSHEVGNESNKIGRWPLSDWPARMEKVAHMKGGGTFKILFRDERGAHKGQVLQTYDKDTYSEGLKTEARTEDPTARILEVMEKQNAAHRAEMSAMQASNQTMMLELVKISAGAKSEGSTTKEVLEMAKFLNDAKGQTKSPLSEMRDLLGLMNELRDDGSVQDASPVERLIGTALGMAKPLLDGVAANLAKTAPKGEGNPNLASPAAPSLSPAIAKALPEIEGPTSTAATASVSPEVKSYAESLKATIEAEMKPGVAAMMATSQIENPEQAQELLDFARKSSVIEDVIKYDPELEEQRPWLELFFQTIIDELTRPPEKLDPVEPVKPVEPAREGELAESRA